MAEDSTAAKIVGLLIGRDPEVTRVILSDGSSRDMPGGKWPDLDSSLDLVLVAFEPAMIVFRSRETDWIYPELPRPNNLAPVLERPLVYLDQNHWSTLSKATYDRDRVPAREMAAADKVIALAKAGRIILPMSSGHLSETGAWGDDESRYRLGLTILQLSRGWQLRDPHSVRRQEFVRDLRSVANLEIGSLPEVITLEPWAIQERLDANSSSFALEGVFSGADTLFLFEILLAGNVYASMFLNTDSLPRDPPGGWTAAQQKFTDWLAGENARSAREKRASAEVFALNDIAKELAEAAVEAGVTPALVSDWMLDKWWNNKIETMPATMIFRNLLVDKHLEPATRWEDNDLTDLWFLAAAAGYSDYVVGEKRTTGLLRQVKQRLSLPVTVVRSLADLVDILPAEVFAEPSEE
ncbi:MAG: hypothetical protein ABIO06_08420 [Pseudolysinimonas sp.]